MDEACGVPAQGSGLPAQVLVTRGQAGGRGRGLGGTRGFWAQEPSPQSPPTQPSACVRTRSHLAPPRGPERPPAQTAGTAPPLGDSERKQAHGPHRASPLPQPQATLLASSPTTRFTRLFPGLAETREIIGLSRPGQVTPPSSWLPGGRHLPPVSPPGSRQRQPHPLRLPSLPPQGGWLQLGGVRDRLDPATEHGGPS